MYFNVYVSDCFSLIAIFPALAVTFVFYHLSRFKKSLLQCLLSVWIILPVCQERICKILVFMCLFSTNDVFMSLTPK